MRSFKKQCCSRRDLDHFETSIGVAHHCRRRVDRDRILFRVLLLGADGNSLQGAPVGIKDNSPDDSVSFEVEILSGTFCSVSDLNLHIP